MNGRKWIAQNKRRKLVTERSAMRIQCLFRQFRAARKAKVLRREKRLRERRIKWLSRGTGTPRQRNRLAHTKNLHNTC